MGLREKLRPLLAWQIGDGSRCHVFGEPWHTGAIETIPPTSAAKKLVLKDLIDPDTAQWDVPVIAQYFGQAFTNSVLASTKPPQNQQRQDRLIFTPAKNGCYSVRGMYHTLRGTSVQSSNQQSQIWRLIWEKGEVTPRLRIFLWKIIQDALPLGKSLFRRRIKVNPTCTVCGEAKEDASHMLFRCPFARACWFTCPLAIRSDLIPPDIKEAMLYLLSIMTKEQWSEAVRVCWAIWRSRNASTYSSQKVQVSDFTKYLSAISAEAMLGGKMGKCRGQSVRGEDPISNQRLETVKGFIYNTDGSWEKEWQGGYGITLQEDGKLVLYVSAESESCSPLHAEAQAFLVAIRMVLERGITSCLFKTDSQIIALAVAKPQPPTDTDWKAYWEMMEIWKVMKKNPGFQCEHISRCQNALADHLAKKGRREGLKHIGYTYPIFPPG